MSEAHTLAPHRRDTAPRRSSGAMLSRVAASLYWMSRQLERAENIARLLDVNLVLLLDAGSIDARSIEEHWLPILRSTDDEELFFRLYEKADSASVTEFLTFRPENPNSVLSCVFAARENARQVRDQISLEMWQVLNECYLFLKSKESRGVWNHGAGTFYERVKRDSHLFQGLTDSTFSRQEGYEFIQFGKFIERADKTTRILDVKYHILLPKASDVGGAVDTAQWQAVLRSASALEAYRRFYVAEILPWKVAEFLVFSDSFPRSIRFCFGEVQACMQRITAAGGRELRPAEVEAFDRLVVDMNTLSIEDVIRRGLHEYMGEVQLQLDRLAQAVYSSFMDHPPVDAAAEIRIHQQEQQQQQVRSRGKRDMR